MDKIAHLIINEAMELITFKLKNKMMCYLNIYNLVYIKVYKFITIILYSIIKLILLYIIFKNISLIIKIYGLKLLYINNND